MLARAREAAQTPAPVDGGLRRLTLPNRRIGYLSARGRYLIVCDGECRRAASPSLFAAGMAAAGHRHASLDGLEEVFLPHGQIVYADPARRGVYWGRLLDVSDGRDLTQAHADEFARARWQRLMRDATPADVHGEGRFAAALLTGDDPNAAEPLRQALLRRRDLRLYVLPGADILAAGQLPALLTPDGRVLSLAGLPAAARPFLPGVLRAWQAEGDAPSAR